MRTPPFQSNYPLEWPPGRPRTAQPRSSKFTNRTLVQARTGVLAELRRLGAHSVVISSNVPMRQTDGLPRAGQTPATDKGVALYFHLQGKSVAFACDRWNRVEDNLHAIGKHLAAMRDLERWGVGSLALAFSAYHALPPASSQRTCWEILGVRAGASVAEIQAAFHQRAVELHPDLGGPEEAMKELTNARSEALKNRGAA